MRNFISRFVSPEISLFPMFAGMSGCEYESLYFGDDGYVIRCISCGHYQLAFGCFSLTLSEQEFHHFCRQVQEQAACDAVTCPAVTRCVRISTPAKGVQLLLTREETNQLHRILDTADAEIKALALLALFNLS